MGGAPPISPFIRQCYHDTVMARRPELHKPEDVLSREHLKQLGKHLSRLSPHAVLDFYQRAYRDCRIINSSTFPTARAVQELVQAWKQLRKWKK
jgi:hypothetical protein